MNKKRVLVGSPVYQKPEILREFLTSLKNQNRKTISIDYMFVDDNADQESTDLLSSFSRENSIVNIMNGSELGEYVCNNESHYWNDRLMLKVANYKNKIIDYAIKNNYDYLFFADSDLVLHPNLIEHLKSLDKAIVSEIFWCSWHTGQPEMPNVWMFDEYDIVPKKFGEVIDEKEKKIREAKFLNMLKKPGVYEVGGLGACTFITVSALKKGVNFSPIKNLTIHGEDRFFCIRAAVLDVDLFVDTNYPAYHIYRESDLLGVPDYIKKCKQENDFVRKFKTLNNKITLSMIVKNEEGRYFQEMLQSLRGHIDAAVIIDDGSTDHTIEICKDSLGGIPLHIVENQKSMFANESSLRQKQWNETIKTNPDWILNLDADEFLEDGFWNHAQEMMDNKDYDLYAFRLFDMWNKTQYREDQYWNAHSIYRPFMIRYQPDFPYKWDDIPQHCGRFPMNILLQPIKNLQFRIKHFGWATHADRLNKKERYAVLDANSIYGIKEQYDSIMDEDPTLIGFDI